MDPGPHELKAVLGVRGLIHLTFSGVSHVPGTALHTRDTAAGSQGRCLHSPRPGANVSTAGRSPGLSQASPCLLRLPQFMSHCHLPTALLLHQCPSILLMEPACFLQRSPLRLCPRSEKLLSPTVHLAHSCLSFRPHVISLPLRNLPRSGSVPFSRSTLLFSSMKGSIVPKPRWARGGLI